MVDRSGNDPVAAALPVWGSKSSLRLELALCKKFSFSGANVRWPTWWPGNILEDIVNKMSVDGQVSNGVNERGLASPLPRTIIHSTHLQEVVWD